MPSQSGELVYDKVIIAILTSRPKDVTAKLCVYVLQCFPYLNFFKFTSSKLLTELVLCSGLQDRDKDNMRLVLRDENGPKHK